MQLTYYNSFWDTKKIGSQQWANFFWMGNSSERCTSLPPKPSVFLGTSIPRLCGGRNFGRGGGIEREWRSVAYLHFQARCSSFEALFQFQVEFNWCMFDFLMDHVDQFLPLFSIASQVSKQVHVRGSYHNSIPFHDDFSVVHVWEGRLAHVNNNLWTVPTERSPQHDADQA